jgi:hypothetical protein
MGVVDKSCTSPTDAKMQLRSSNICHLFVISDGIALFKLSFVIVNEKYFRAALLQIDDWDHLEKKLFAIAL